MLHHKCTNNINELSSYFQKSTTPAMTAILNVIQGLCFSDRQVDLQTSRNATAKTSDKLLLLLLFPMFEIKNAYSYCSSRLYPIYRYGKDMFYRIQNSTAMDWRSVNYVITRNLINRAGKESHGTRCLIADDTDLIKRGYHIELIGKIYSHVTHSFNLGFKGLFLGYHDGKSFFGLDFSLHGEKGKKENYGLTPKQLKSRYTKKRASDNPDYQRVVDYNETKVDSLIWMIRNATKRGIRFDYLLVDSWFTSEKLLRFVKGRRMGCHFLGMVKLGKTKYTYRDKELTAEQLINRNRKAKRSKVLGYRYLTFEAEYKGIPVKLFFCKTSRRGIWNALLSTNIELNFDEAYRIYATRWSIEVFFKECKQYLGLGKCQSRDFDAQIAGTTLSMLRYNILSLAKRFCDYESLGDLFRGTCADSIQPTISERIWLILCNTVAKLAEIFEKDEDFIMAKIITDNEQFTKYLNLKPLTQAG